MKQEMHQICFRAKIACLFTFRYKLEYVDKWT